MAHFCFWVGEWLRLLRENEAVDLVGPKSFGDKAKRYVGEFFEGTRLGTKISAKVIGNHGTYAVSIYREG